MKWFRFYTEVLDDPKVQLLDSDIFRAWVNLLCLASRNDGILPGLKDIAFALRTDIAGAQSILDRLTCAGLLDRQCGGANGYRYVPHNWLGRQYKSDTSTERVKRFRKRGMADTETSPDTEAEAEKEGETENPLISPKISRKPKRPIPEHFQPHAFSAGSPCRAIVDNWSRLEFERQLEHFQAYHGSVGSYSADWQAMWSKWVLKSQEFAERRKCR